MVKVMAAPQAGSKAVSMVKVRSGPFRPCAPCVDDAHVLYRSVDCRLRSGAGRALELETPKPCCVCCGDGVCGGPAPALAIATATLLKMSQGHCPPGAAMENMTSFVGAPELPEALQAPAPPVGPSTQGCTGSDPKDPGPGLEGPQPQPPAGT